MEFASRVGLLRPTPLHGRRRPSLPSRSICSPATWFRCVRRRDRSRHSTRRASTGASRSTARCFPSAATRIASRTGSSGSSTTARAECSRSRADCLILDGVVCSGERSVGRWFCPRDLPLLARSMAASRRRAHRASRPELSRDRLELTASRRSASAWSCYFDVVAHIISQMSIAQPKFTPDTTAAPTGAGHPWPSSCNSSRRDSARGYRRGGGRHQRRLGAGRLYD